jgi:hypothetical protein
MTLKGRAHLQDVDIHGIVILRIGWNYMAWINLFLDRIN